MSSTELRTFLASSGDVSSPNTWSGIPFHFMDAARPSGLVDEGLALHPDMPKTKCHRIIWNVIQTLLFRGAGGFQYSVPYLETLWEPVQTQIPGSRIISTMPLYAPSVVRRADIDRWYYMDGTLLQSFNYYRVRAGARIQREAISRERDGYEKAVGIMTLSRFAAQSVIDDYGIEPQKVHAVHPGANILRDDYAAWERQELERREYSALSDQSPLRLVMVGKFWKRKGLDRLLRALKLAHDRGASTILRIIGCDQESLPAHLRDVKNVEWMGLINKATDAPRWLASVSECDIGVLLSRADFSPIALREYRALGLATIATRTGGMPELVAPGGSVLIEPDASCEELAELLVQLERDRDHVHAMRQKAWETRHEALWARTVKKMLNLWPYPVN